MQNNDNPKWIVIKTTEFKKQVKDLTKETKGKLGQVMTSMLSSNTPNHFGKKKNTKYGEAFVVDIDRSNRLSYTVNFIERTITVIRVGGHNEVYGKD